MLESLEEEYTIIVLSIVLFLSLHRAKAALREATQRVATEMEVLSSPIVLEFGGLSSFSTRVIFAAIKETPAKEKLTSVAGQDKDYANQFTRPKVSSYHKSVHILYYKAGPKIGG